jgi:hypothetical protein
MHFPRTFNQIELAGYHFNGMCAYPGCGKQIEFWTPPGAQSAAYDLMKDGESPGVCPPMQTAACRGPQSAAKGTLLSFRWKNFRRVSYYE